MAAWQMFRAEHGPPVPCIRVGVGMPKVSDEAFGLPPRHPTHERSAMVCWYVEHTDGTVGKFSDELFNDLYRPIECDNCGSYTPDEPLFRNTGSCSDKRSRPYDLNSGRHRSNWCRFHKWETEESDG